MAAVTIQKSSQSRILLSSIAGQTHFLSFCIKKRNKLDPKVRNLNYFKIDKNSFFDLHDLIGVERLKRL